MSILRFDHISKVVKKNGFVPDGYKFMEKNIKNTNGRFMFMSHDFYDINMYYYPMGDENTTIPVEIVAYDNLKSKSNVEVFESGFTCKVDRHKVDKVINAFSMIGLKSKDDWNWELSGSLDKNRAIMKLIPIEEIHSIPIDSEGYNCPCFLVKNTSELFENMEDISSVNVSSVDMLKVNGRDLDVGFMAIDGFELVFEFISLHR